jgi:hypothetical protein
LGDILKFLRKFAEIFATLCLAGVNDPGEKLLTGVNDAGDQLSAVSLLPAINYRLCP